LVAVLCGSHAQRPSHSLLRRAGRAPAQRVTSTLRTARCGPACRVVWQGTRGIALGPYADCIQDEYSPMTSTVTSSLLTRSLLGACATLLAVACSSDPSSGVRPDDAANDGGGHVGDAGSDVETADDRRDARERDAGSADEIRDEESDDARGEAGVSEGSD